jgi:hypothetical protein
LAKKNMVRISLPNRYGPSVRADLEAGPTVVDLHSMAPCMNHIFAALLHAIDACTRLTD